MFIEKRKPLCDTRNKNGGARREFWQGKSDLNRFKRSINLKEKKTVIMTRKYHSQATNRGHE